MLDKTVWMGFSYVFSYVSDPSSKTYYTVHAMKDMYEADRSLNVGFLVELKSI